MLTVNQRDLLALYCVHMGIKSPTNIKHHIEMYEEVRDIVDLCEEENARKEKETNLGESGLHED